MKSAAKAEKGDQNGEGEEADGAEDEADHPGGVDGRKMLNCGGKRMKKGKEEEKEEEG